MKILLVNDTSNNSHYGCQAVSNALRTYLDRHGATAVQPVFNRQLACTSPAGGFSDDQHA